MQSLSVLVKNYGHEGVLSLPDIPPLPWARVLFSLKKFDETACEYLRSWARREKKYANFRIKEWTESAESEMCLLKNFQNLKLANFILSLLLPFSFDPRSARVIWTVSLLAICSSCSILRSWLSISFSFSKLFFVVSESQAHTHTCYLSFNFPSFASCQKGDFFAP